MILTWQNTPTVSYSGPYRVCYGIRDWSAWIYSATEQRRLGNYDLRSLAKQACERDWTERQAVTGEWPNGA